MNSKNKVFGFALVAFLALGCGNYSNEDLDFQLALPEQSELEIHMPQALSVGNAAEYYTTTRNVVVTVNAMAAALVGVVDTVRGITPTSRNGNERVWGPFPEEKHPSWLMRVRMSRVDQPTGVRFDYHFELRPAAQPKAEFIELMGGWYSATGSAKRGKGRLVFDTTSLRDAGFPIDDDFKDLVKLSLDYDTASFPVTIQMKTTKLVGADQRDATYDYQRNADGSGQLSFVWQLDQAVGTINELAMTSRWLESGAGRADASLAVGGRVIGTDCWGIDTVATYRLRTWASAADQNFGAADTCLVP
jgi:hypothetical protein